MKAIASLSASVAAAVLAAGACFAAGEVDLPVTQVTAFSSGVAYFGHSGKIAGDAKVLLKFKTEQINDVLKSLVLMDLGGGDVTGVSYASRDPVSRALKSFGVDISGEPTLAELLQQIRGAKVVVAAGEKVTGSILGVETRTRQLLPSNTLVKQRVLNLTTADGIRAILLETIASIALADEKLNAELNKALALLVESRDSNRKPVTIHFSGKGARAVQLGYIAEAPVWKTSYRLVLGEKDISLQGWAIVENTSDFDWEKVDLTLVSGRPISFIQDLYTPLYLPRPVVQPKLYASLRPQTYDEGLLPAEKAKQLALAKRAADSDRYRRRAAGAARPGVALAGRGRAEAERKAGKADYARALQQGVQSVAAAGKVGEMFSYHISTPVTLQRRKSAMLPIVNKPVKARKVSIYNASALAKHPLNGLWVTNDTGLSLLAGPVTVFDGGTYAGDAQIDNLSPNDKRLLSYAIDLKVTVDSSASSTSKITSVRIVRGVLYVSRKHTYVRTYLIKNKADKKRPVLIEHPYRSNLRLISPAKPTEKTAKLYRFEVEVPAGETGKLKVTEERTDSQTIAILPASVGSLKWYSTSTEIPEAVRKAIAEAIRRKQALEAVTREIRELQQKIARLEADQKRIRANMGALAKGSTGYQRFEKKLLDAETEIEKLQGRIEKLQAKAKDLRNSLEEHLNNLNVK